MRCVISAVCMSMIRYSCASLFICASGNSSRSCSLTSPYLCGLWVLIGKLPLLGHQVQVYDLSSRYPVIPRRGTPFPFLAILSTILLFPICNPIPMNCLSHGKYRCYWPSCLLYHRTGMIVIVRTPFKCALKWKRIGELSIYGIWSLGCGWQLIRDVGWGVCVVVGFWEHARELLVWLSCESALDRLVGRGGRLGY